MTRDETAREMRALGWWFQHFDLPNGLNTGEGQPGGYDAMARWRHIEPYVPARLDGKTVLDLGGNAGFFAVQMKLRGASRCVLVDPFVEFNRQARFAARQFGVEIEVVNDDAHTYCLTTEAHFDYVVFLGLFYHLKYPGLVLDRVAEMTRDRLYFQSHTIGHPAPTFESRSDYRLRVDDAEIEQAAFPKLAFLEGRYNGDDTNWWLPNDTALAAMVRSAGMTILARPHPQVVIAEPRRRLGTKVYAKLVFPVYAKEGGATYPGPQSFGGGTVDAGEVLSVDVHGPTGADAMASLVFDVLPQVRAGTVILVHGLDPSATAAALLRAFLQFNDVFEIWPSERPGDVPSGTIRLRRTR